MKHKKNEFDENRITCITCRKSHFLPDLLSLQTSKIIYHILSNTNQHTSIGDSSKLLKSFTDGFTRKMNQQKNSAIKHYESIYVEIENRAQHLIEVKF